LADFQLTVPDLIGVETMDEHLQWLSASALITTEQSAAESYRRMYAKFIEICSIWMEWRDG